MSYSQVILAESSLVSYWRLDDASGTNVADSKGANTGTYVSGFTLSQGSLIASDPDSAVALDSTTACSITLPVSMTAPCSLEMWIKSTGVNNADASLAVARDASATGGWINVFLSTTLATRVSGTTFTGSTASGALFDGKAHHLVQTIDNASPHNVALYLDGVVIASGTIVSPVASVSPINLGKNGTNAQYLTCNYDEVAYYNAALTSAQVATHLYAAQSFPPFRSPAAPRRLPGRARARQQSVPRSSTVPVLIWPPPRLRASHSPIGAAARGRRSFPVQPQIPVPPTIPGKRAPAGRRWMVSARGHRWPLITEQPQAPVRPRRPARTVAPSRGRRFTFVPQDPATPVRIRARARGLAARRTGRVGTAPHGAHIQITNRTPAPSRRSWIAPRRGSRTVPVAGQAAPVAPKWPPATIRSRPRPGMLRRGHRFDPAWPITIVPPPPSICYPTVASIVSYQTAAGITPRATVANVAAYSSTAAIGAYTSAAAVTGYGSSAAIRSYASTGTVTSYTSSAGVVRYTTSVAIQTCGL